MTTTARVIKICEIGLVFEGLIRVLLAICPILSLASFWGVVNTRGIKMIREEGKPDSVLSDHLSRGDV